MSDYTCEHHKPFMGRDCPECAAQRKSPRPTIGRIVHITRMPRVKAVPTSDNPPPNILVHVAAIVTGTDSAGNLSLTSFESNGTAFPYKNVAEDQSAQTPLTWHWPEREDAPAAEEPRVPVSHFQPNSANGDSLLEL